MKSSLFISIQLLAQVRLSFVLRPIFTDEDGLLGLTGFLGPIEDWQTIPRQ